MKNILYLFFLLPVLGFSQSRYGVEGVPMCWTISGKDSSIVRYVLISSTGKPVKTVAYENAQGAVINVSGGVLRYGFCDCAGGLDSLANASVTWSKLATPVKDSIRAGINKVDTSIFFTTNYNLGTAIDPDKIKRRYKKIVISAAGVGSLRTLTLPAGGNRMTDVDIYVVATEDTILVSAPSNDAILSQFRKVQPGRTNNYQCFTVGAGIVWKGSAWDSLGAIGVIKKSPNKDSIGVSGNFVIDNDNDYSLAVYSTAKMKNLAKSISSISSSNFQIALIGDSKTEQSGGIVASIYPEFQKHLTFSGFGLVQAGSGSPVLNNAASPSLATANWTLKDRNTGGRGLSLHSIVSTVSSTAWGWIGQPNSNEYNKWTDVQIMWYGVTGGGSFEVRVDGVLAGTINTGSAIGFNTTTYLGYSDIETHTVLITPLGAGCEILGIILSRSGINGVRLNRFGQTGAVVADYTNRADTALWNRQLRILSPKLCIINLGSNEILRDTTLVGFKREAKKFILQIKKALSYNVDILWVGVTPMSGPTYTKTLAYVDVVRQLCIEDTISMADPGLFFGPYSANSGLYSDGIHENAVGGAIVAKSIVSGLAITLNEDNFSNKYLKQFGNITPLSTSGHNASKIPFINSLGVFTTSGGPGYDGISISFSGNMTAGNVVTGLTLRSSSAPFSGGNNFSARASMGFFGFTAGENLLQAGFAGGIRQDASHSTIRFQSSNQNALKDNWVFEGFAAGVWKQWSTGASIIRQAYGFDDSGNSGTAAFFRSNNSINQTSNTRITIKDHYLETRRNSMVGVNHISLNNKWGDNYFNSQQGSTAIGVQEDTVTHHPTINRSAKLQINATDKGFLLPSVTVSQRDSIKTNGIQKIAIGGVGSGYTSDPTVVITGGGGNFATAIALRSPANGISMIEITNPGRGYTSAPTVTITGGGGSGATATATVYSSDGLQVFNSTTKAIDVFLNGSWFNLIPGLIGNGSPEGVVNASVGSIFLRKDGGAGTTFYVKESGTGNTGWVAK